jgi:tetratricopeptide (TPR) repeat protein
MSKSDPPGYLGRVLTEGGMAIGTCFQVRPGVLVTASHVVEHIGDGTAQGHTYVDPIAGGVVRSAQVREIDKLRDLAVLVCAPPLDECVSGFLATDSISAGTAIQVTGVSRFVNAQPFRYTSTTGVWEGCALRNDGVALGQMIATGLVKGMSGAPVRRISDDMVIGIISARYNSPNQWMRNTAWVARTEDLSNLSAAAVEMVPLLAERSPKPDTDRASVRGIQLPRDVDDFVGRTVELQSLTRIANSLGNVRTPNVVIVTGPPGIGKSTLTIRFAHHVRQMFTATMYYLDLRGGESRPLEPEEAMEELIVSMGKDLTRLPKTLSARSSVLRSYLSESRCVLILDNVMTARQAKHLLPGDRTCLTLISSRKGMFELPNATRIDLQPLRSSETRQFFAITLGNARVSAEPEATEALVGLCANSPLAARIVSARLAAHPARRLEDFRRTLESDHRRLAELEIGDLAIRSSFELSYRELRPETQELFRLCSMLPGIPFTVGCAAVLAGIGFHEAQERIYELVEAHLIDVPGRAHVAESKVRYHDLIRLYAAGLLREADPPELQEAAKERLVTEYFAGVIARWHDRREEWGARVPSERDSVTGSEIGDRSNAGDWFADNEDVIVHCIHLSPELGRISDTMMTIEVLVQHLESIARWSRWKELGQFWLSLAEQCTDKSSVARAHRSLARMLRESGDWRLAEHHFLKSADAAREIADRAAEAHSLRGIGTLHRYRGKHGAAEDAFAKALELFREADDVRGEAWTLRSLALLARDRGAFEDARSLGVQSLSIFRRIGDYRGQASTLRNLAIVYTRTRRFSEARDLFEEAMSLYRGMMDPRGTGSTLRNMGDMYAAMGEYKLATGLVSSALTLLREIGDRHWEAAGLRSLAEISTLTGDLEDSVNNYERALAVYSELGDEPRRVAVEAALALAREAAQDSDQ